MCEHFSNGIQKLYNSVSKGLGTVMLPKEVKGILEKEVKQIEMIDVEGGLVGEVVEGFQGELAIEDVKELYGRTCSRMLYQEMRKQENIENVVEVAKELLTDENVVDSEDVSEDWMFRFFNSVQDISNDDMQKLWGKILAGEVKHPNSFSVRSLDTLSKMSEDEAKIFESLRPYIIKFRGTWAIINNEELNNKYQINYEKILSMAECGLMDSSAIMSLTMKIIDKYPLEIVYNKSLLKTCSEEEKKITISIYKLTKIGIELLNILEKKYDDNYFQDVSQWIAKNNNNLEFVMHEVVCENEDGTISYIAQGTKVVSG